MVTIDGGAYYSSNRLFCDDIKFPSKQFASLPIIICYCCSEWRSFITVIAYRSTMRACKCWIFRSFESDKNLISILCDPYVSYIVSYYACSVVDIQCNFAYCLYRFNNHFCFSSLHSIECCCCCCCFCCVMEFSYLSFCISSWLGCFSCAQICE